MKRWLFLLLGIFFLLTGCQSIYYKIKDLPEYTELPDKDFIKAPSYALSLSNLLPDNSPKAFAYDPDKLSLVDSLLKEVLENKGYHTEDFTKCLSFSKLSNVEHVIEVLNIQYAYVTEKDGMVLVYRMVVMVRTPGKTDSHGQFTVPHARFFQVFHKKEKLTATDLRNPFTQGNLKPLFGNLMKNRAFREALQPGGLNSGVPLTASKKRAAVKLVRPAPLSFVSWQDIPDSVLPAGTETERDKKIRSRLCGRWRCDNFGHTVIQKGKIKRSFVSSGMVEYLFLKDGSYSSVQILKSFKKSLMTTVSEGKWKIQDGWLYLTQTHSPGKFSAIKCRPLFSEGKPETVKCVLDTSHYREQYKKIHGINAIVTQKKSYITLNFVQNGTRNTQLLFMDSFKRIVNPVPAKKK